MTVAVSPSPSDRRTLTVCGGAHALHDGFTDLLNVLYPLLQSQFGLSYAAIGALKTVYSGAMASGQIPSGKLAERFGGVRVLALGTTLIAVGYCLAGFTGSLYGVIAGLLLAGLGGSTQHPIASSLVAAAYHGPRSRTALGTYNFTGDVGKVLLPALFALVAASLGWQQAMVVMAALAVARRQHHPGVAEADRDARHGRAGEGHRRPGPAVGLLAAVLDPHRRRPGAHRLPDLPAVSPAGQGRRPADHRPRPVAAVRRRRRGQAGDGLGRPETRRRALGRADRGRDDAADPGHPAAVARRWRSCCCRRSG